MLAACVQQIILGCIVTKYVQKEVQAPFVLDTEHVMEAHQCQQEIVFVRKVGRETIGKFMYFYFVPISVYNSL